MKKSHSITLDPSDLGRRDGLRNFPATDAKTPCNSEEQIRRNREREAEVAHDDFAHAVAELEPESTAILGSLQLSAITEPRKDFGLQLLEAKASNKEILLKATQEHSKCKRILASWEDRFPFLATASRSRSRPLLATLLLVEALLNSYFIGQGSNWGLLGGALEALTIATLSIVVAYSLGMVIQALLAMENRSRYLAYPLAFAGAAGIALYHFLIGHYRGCLIYGNPQTAVSDALVNFKHYGTTLPDLYCYGLVVVGLLFAGTAFREGFRCKEEGLKANHFRLVKKTKAAVFNLRQKEQNYYAALNQVYMGQLEAIDQKVKETGLAGYRLRMSILEGNRLNRHFAERMNTIRDEYISDMENYWRSNSFVRNTNAPAYSKAPPAPLVNTDLTIDQPFLKAANEMTARLDERLDEIQKTAEAEKDKIRAEYEAALKDAPRLFQRLRDEADILSVKAGTGGLIREDTSILDIRLIDEINKAAAMEKSGAGTKYAAPPDDSWKFDAQQVEIKSPG